MSISDRQWINGGALLISLSRPRPIANSRRRSRSFYLLGACAKIMWLYIHHVGMHSQPAASTFSKALCRGQPGPDNAGLESPCVYLQHPWLNCFRKLSGDSGVGRLSQRTSSTSVLPAAETASSPQFNTETPAVLAWRSAGRMI